MFRSIAIAPEDGWAFVKDGKGSVRLVRPPYRKNNVSIVSEETVEKAISTHGFIAEEKDFPDWYSLIIHLRDRLIQERKAQGRSVPGLEAARNLVQYAPQHVVKNYLDRVETDLFPESNWDAAMSLLLVLLESQGVKVDEGLKERTTTLLRKCWELRQRQEQDQLGLIGKDITLAELCPMTTGLYPPHALNDYVRTVSENGSLMTAGMR